ncbi:hypothetical protein D3C84_1007380 [compost metagenome]
MEKPPLDLAVRLAGRVPDAAEYTHGAVKLVMRRQLLALAVDVPLHFHTTQPGRRQVLRHLTRRAPRFLGTRGQGGQRLGIQQLQIAVDLLRAGAPRRHRHIPTDRAAPMDRRIGGGAG